MSADPILKEYLDERDRIAKKCDYNIDAICRYYGKVDVPPGFKVVRLKLAIPKVA